MSKRPRWRMKSLINGTFLEYSHPSQHVTLYNDLILGTWQVWVNFEKKVHTPDKSVAVRYVVDNGWGLDDE